MGLFLRQQESRSKLQSRLDKELQGKLKQDATASSPEVDSQFLDDNHQTTRASLIWIIVIALIIIAAIVWFIITS